MVQPTPFTSGQQVMVDGTMYIFRHLSTAAGEPPKGSKRKGGSTATAWCKFAVVNLPGSDKPIVVRHDLIQTVAEAVASEPVFTEGTQVTVRGVPHIFQHYCNAKGGKTRGLFAASLSKHAMVHLPNDATPVVVRRELLNTPAELNSPKRSKKNAAAAKGEENAVVLDAAPATSTAKPVSPQSARFLSMDDDRSIIITERIPPGCDRYFEVVRELMTARA